MADILFVRQMQIGRFYAHRISRIFPALWLFVFSMLIATQFAPRLNVDWKGVITALTFTTNYLPSQDAMAHIWSLCVEEHAYILLSFIAILHRRFSINPVIIIASISALMVANGAIQTWVFHRDATIYWQSDVRAASVLISGLLYLHFRDRTVHVLLPVTAIAIGFTIYLTGSVPLLVKQTVATFFISLGMATLGNSPSSVLSILSSRVPTQLGAWSFSLYLWQQPFTHYNGYPLPVLLMMLSAVSLVSFYLVEQPCRAFLNWGYEKLSHRAQFESHPQSSPA
jgi:peptidoglycan/LPS O-acetylase OafA/YrhL